MEQDQTLPAHRVAERRKDRQASHQQAQESSEAVQDCYARHCRSGEQQRVKHARQSKMATATHLRRSLHSCRKRSLEHNQCGKPQPAHQITTTIIRQTPLTETIAALRCLIISHSQFIIPLRHAIEFTSRPTLIRQDISCVHRCVCVVF